MTALNQLAARLRLNAASMDHGEAEADIRAAADILDTFASVSPEHVGSGYIRDAEKKLLISPKAVCDLFTQAQLRAEFIGGEGSGK